ncbi:S-methyl-5'-thioinosine phosphorylase [Sansalvadorimonas sp. 2012CJ34-2]|uniref:Probable S-methyl-5'-thioinosine phosphorylase n=1 Tax=Parendozoicomonas callyspongiae TaxID=2942213 RepID=A0ABT0PEJ8_9GAMM|nr:S-methyl-5'-thioinosine phosphorylase [Sansalvadorimonas sp. 2012CJ34-2]MCL6269807.1 S-methyl-5'-thioinosine phosphorylase [Sansalvadorimonas sp. 2012CJ34-2]
MLTAVIGGTGLTRLSGLEVKSQESVSNRWGDVSAPLVYGVLKGAEIVFLTRHGAGYNMPPHCINYRANIQALKDAGVGHIIAVNAVGGISQRMDTGVICIPDQIIDYSWGRKTTFFEGSEHPVFIDFTHPYDPGLRDALHKAAMQLDIPAEPGGVYGCTQGPRLETAAEIRRMEKDGCDIVGMTGMPEAVLAREAGIKYSVITLAVNRAAGKSDQEITMAAMQSMLQTGMEKICAIISEALSG